MDFQANETRLAYEYRCRVTDSNGIWFSNAVKVELSADPVITVTVEKNAVAIGEQVVYNVTTTNTVGTLAYQWQKSNDGGETWTATTLPGNKTAQMRFQANASRLA